MRTVRPAIWAPLQGSAYLLFSQCVALGWLILAFQGVDLEISRSSGPSIGMKKILWNYLNLAPFTPDSY